MYIVTSLLHMYSHIYGFHVVQYLYAKNIYILTLGLDVMRTYLHTVFSLIIRLGSRDGATAGIFLLVFLAIKVVIIVIGPFRAWYEYLNTYQIIQFIASYIQLFKFMKLRQRPD